MIPVPASESFLEQMRAALRDAARHEARRDCIRAHIAGVCAAALLELAIDASNPKEVTA